MITLAVGSSCEGYSVGRNERIWTSSRGITFFIFVANEHFMGNPTICHFVQQVVFRLGVKASSLIPYLCHFVLFCLWLHLCFCSITCVKEKWQGNFLAWAGKEAKLMPLKWHKPPDRFSELNHSTSCFFFVFLLGIKLLFLVCAVPYWFFLSLTLSLTIKKKKKKRKSEVNILRSCIPSSPSSHTHKNIPSILMVTFFHSAF